MKKVAITTSIVGSVGCAGILIAAIFGLELTAGLFLDLLFTFIAITVASILCFTPISIIENKQKIGWLGLSLLLLSTAMVIIAFWVKSTSDIYDKITYTVSILSVAVSLVLGNVVVLKRSNLLIQIIVYCFLLASIVLSLFLVYGVELDLGNIFGKIFLSIVIFTVVGLIILLVLRKKGTQQSPNNKVNKLHDDEMITIKKSEYEALIEKIKNYEKNEKNI